MSENWHMQQHGLSIRRVLIGLGALSILIAAGLAGSGLLGIQRQLDARQRLVMFDQASNTHNEADSFMDDIRADVLRALQNSIGSNKEGAAAIRADLQHHIEVVSSGIAQNVALALTADLHNSYVRISDLAASFLHSGQAAVELALADPVAGAENFERFRHSFSALEEAMDDVRDVLRAKVKQVRAKATLTAARAIRTIVASSLAGILLLIVTTAIAVRIARGITADLANSREEARRLSMHDTLTGLPNRAFLSERLSQALAHARRHGGMAAMLCLDLDRFKHVNDTLGHPVGDLLLRAVADRLRGCVRRSDTVARLGGDEFAIIQAPVARAEEAGSLARCVVAALSEPYDLDGQQVTVGASVGIALAPTDTADADCLHKMADMALYRAKAEGRGAFRFFEPGMDEVLQARRTLELDLHKAVARQEFELNYQPLVNLASGRVDALEALVRWRHPQRGLVAPGDFIPLAEETGIVVPLGAWVLHQACQDAAGWPADVRIAVNVSAAQFKGSGLVAAVDSALAAAGLSGGRLELEITETALLTDAQATRAVLGELRAKGVRIALDDFGTGYASLAYLRSFPFDKVKVDRCFVEDIETSADCKAIVRAVAGLGADLGIVTTAEGVETLAQLDRLRAEGCDQGQGYLFSRPVPAAAVAALLDRKWVAEAQGAREPGAPEGGRQPRPGLSALPPVSIDPESDLVCISSDCRETAWA